MISIMNDEDIMDRMDNALNQLEAWQRTVLFLDVENEFEARNEILAREVKISTQIEITRYMQRLKNKLKELVETGKYQPKHKNSEKLTLKGF